MTIGHFKNPWDFPIAEVYPVSKPTHSMEIGGKTSTEIAPGLELPHLSSAPGQLPPPR